jgi:DNA-binding NtrC family response regulator
MRPKTSPPRIFVVDDDPAIASTLATILDINGFSARSFRRPTEVLSAAQTDIPDLLISDVAMPDLSGIDLAIQMRVNHPKCKILLFSGQAHASGLLEDARQQGYHFRLLVKPVFPSQLLSEIEKICDEREWRTDTVGQVGPHIVGNHRLNKTPEA